MTTTFIITFTIIILPFNYFIISARIIFMLISVAPSVKAAVFLAAGAIGICLMFVHIKQTHSIPGAKHFSLWSISHILTISLNSFCFACLVNDWIKHTDKSCFSFGSLSDITYVLARITLWMFLIQRSMFILEIIISESIWYRILKILRFAMILYAALGIGNIFLTNYQPPTEMYPICNRRPSHWFIPIIAWVLDFCITSSITMCFVAPLWKQIKESIQ